MTIQEAIERIQFSYPQIYYACHTRHQRRRSNAFRLSTRDAEILIHLDRSVPTTLSALAGHMDLAASTLSEAISRLVRHGYVLKSVAQRPDRRRVGLVLSPRGMEAVLATSVLEPRRLEAVLDRLTKRELATVVDGLSLLARACRRSRAETREVKGSVHA